MAVPKTEETCIQTGPYACTGCAHRVVLAEGRPIPSCPFCKAEEASYRLVGPTST
jgi:hypothetical protein